MGLKSCQSCEKVFADLHEACPFCDSVLDDVVKVGIQGKGGEARGGRGPTEWLLTFSMVATVLLGANLWQGVQRYGNPMGALHREATAEAVCARSVLESPSGTVAARSSDTTDPSDMYLSAGAYEVAGSNNGRVETTCEAAPADSRNGTLAALVVEQR